MALAAKPMIPRPPFQCNLVLFLGTQSEVPLVPRPPDSPNPHPRLLLRETHVEHPDQASRLVPEENLPEAHLLGPVPRGKKCEALETPPPEPVRAIEDPVPGREMLAPPPRDLNQRCHASRLHRELPPDKKKILGTESPIDTQVSGRTYPHPPNNPLFTRASPRRGRARVYQGRVGFPSGNFSDRGRGISFGKLNYSGREGSPSGNIFR